MSNSFDQDQDRHNVGPDLGPNCLQRLSAEDQSCPSMERGNKNYATEMGFSCFDIFERKKLKAQT